MADTAPLLVITEVGLAAASVATPTGPWVNITGFRIGSGFGYTPLSTDTDINGALLYEGVPTAYRYVGNNTLDVILKIPPDVGPFEFGEVALDLAGPTMFAKAVFETPQTKYSSLGSNVLSTYTFHALIKLAQSVAIFQVDTILGEPPAILELDRWSDVYPAAQSANPEVPALLIKELDHLGNSTLIHQATDQLWTVGTNYVDFGARTVVSATTTSVQFTKSSFSGQDMSLSQNRQFVISVDTSFRSVASITDAGANWAFNLNPAPLAAAPAAGTQARLYRSGPVSFRGLQDVPLASATTQGIGSLGTGMNASTPGVISANGLLHNGQNTGRFLGSSDSLDFITPGQTGAGGHWPSGLYTVGFDDMVQGAPPVGAVSGLVEIVNTLVDVSGRLGVVNQTWYPSAANSADLPAYFRSLLVASPPEWTPWRRISVAPATSGGLTKVSVPNIRSYTMPNDRIGYYNLYRQEPAGNILPGDLYLNGVHIVFVDVEPGNSGQYTIPLNPGDVVTYTGETGSAENTYALVWLYPAGINSWS